MTDLEVAVVGVSMVIGLVGFVAVFAWIVSVTRRGPPR